MFMCFPEEFFLKGCKLKPIDFPRFKQLGRVVVKRIKKGVVSYKLYAF